MVNKSNVWPSTELVQEWFKEYRKINGIKQIKKKKVVDRKRKRGKLIKK